MSVDNFVVAVYMYLICVSFCNHCHCSHLVVNKFLRRTQIFLSAINHIDLYISLMKLLNFFQVDDIDATIQEVNELLGNSHGNQSGASAFDPSDAMTFDMKALLTVEHR